MILRKHFQPHIGSCLHKSFGTWPASDDKYYFDFGGYQDTVTSTALPAANYEGTHTNLVNGELVTYTADQYVRDAQGHPLTFGAYSQLCLYSENPGAAGWTSSASFPVTRSANAENNIGPFLAYKLTAIDNLIGRYYFVRTKIAPASGDPVGVQYIRLYYLPGSSNKICIIFRDGDEATESMYAGIIGSASVTGIDAGTLTLVSDSLDLSLGCRVAVLRMDFTNKTNTLFMGVGPYSATAGEDIIILGADVFNTSTWRPHVPSSGSVVSVSSTQYDYNGGSPRGPRFALSDVPLADAALEADGQIEWRGTPLFNATNTSADGKIITVNETGTLLAHTPEGEFESSDGTQAANKDVDYVKNTEYLVKVPYGDKAGADKQQVFVNGVSGDLADFDGSFNPDTYLGIGGSAMPMAHSSIKIRKKASW